MGLNELFKELYADKLEDLFQEVPMPPPEFKVGDKVRLIKPYWYPPRYTMGTIYTVSINPSISNDLYVKIGNSESGDFLNGTAKGYFELVEEKQEKLVKVTDNGWGDW